MNHVMKKIVVIAAVLCPVSLLAQPVPHWNQLDAFSSSVKKEAAAKVAKSEQEVYADILAHLSTEGEVFYSYTYAFHNAIQAADKKNTKNVFTQILVLAERYKAYSDKQEALFAKWDKELREFSPAVTTGASAREMWSMNRSEINQQKKIVKAKKEAALKEKIALLKFANKPVGSFQLLKDGGATLSLSSAKESDKQTVNRFLADVEEAVSSSLK